MQEVSVHESWSSRSAFVLAAVGAAVGLGNIWRFPFMAGQNGGGAFVLVYVGFVLLLAIPIISAELAMGRRGSQSAVLTMSRLAGEANRSQGWQVIGWLSILVPMLGLTYYSVVAAWSLDYVVQSAMGSFTGID
jgi:NSS family neurotransmitter:Na+ symporter